MKRLIAFGLAFSMLAFALGVPLLAWGIADWRGFAASPVRLLYAVSVAVQSLVAGLGYLLLPFPYEPGRRGGERGKLVSRQSIVPIVTRLIWLAAFVIAPYSDRHNWAVIAGAEWLHYAGVPVYLAGLGWVYWAFLTLGKQHSAEVTIQKGHELVTRGPYRWLRHPMYLGLIVFPMGVGLVFGSWIAAALPLLSIGLFAWRVGDEEELLRREFGEQWEAYCRRTWRFIPYVY